MIQGVMEAYSCKFLRIFGSFWKFFALRFGWCWCLGWRGFVCLLVVNYGEGMSFGLVVYLLQSARVCSAGIWWEREEG